MLSVTLLTKPGCHLCDEARDHLDDWAADHEIDLHEVDIRSDDALFELYRYRIPVILVDNEVRLEGRITADDVASALGRQ